MIETGERYRTLKPLGQGGVGAVFLVEDRTNGDHVALKVLAGAGEADEATLLRFKQEFRIMAGLRHANLCAVHDFGKLPDGAPYFTMEHVPGADLHEAIPPELEALKPLVGQLCTALGHLHQQGFVHCDLKPENVRVRPDGVLKLMDFGLIEVAGQAPEAIKGTLAYVSPEVAKRDRVDQRSDLYSLGALLYELVTGQVPFRGASALEILRAHLGKAPRPVAEVRPGVPDDLARVIMKLLAKEPTARYQSAWEVMEALGLEVGEHADRGLLASPFVGREAELSRLDAALARLEHEKVGGVLRLCGPAGAGKARLLGELRSRAQLSSLPFLHGRAPGGPAAYGAWLGALRALLPVARERCPQTLEAQAPFLGKLLPELAGGHPGPELEPDDERRLIQAAIARVLVDASTRGGLVLVLEGWERADAPSREALTYLLRNVQTLAEANRRPDAGLLVVVSGREVADVAGETLELGGLALAQTRGLLEGMLGQADVPAPLVSQLHQLTQGNPRLLANTLEHLVTNGVATHGRGGWRLPKSLDASDLAADARDFLLARLEKLSPDANTVARVAALLGREFEPVLLAAVLDLDEDRLLDSLTALLHERVLEASGDGYRFGAPELAALLSERTPVEERMHYHRLAARKLESTFPEEGEAPLATLDRVARHYLAAREAERGLPLALAAARRNRHLFANEAAHELLSASLELFDHVADREAFALLRCEVLNEEAACLRWFGRLDEAQRLGEEAAAIAESHGADNLLMAALIGLAQAYALSGKGDNHRKAHDITSRALPLARKLGDYNTLARVATTRARGLMFLGERAEAREGLEAVVQECRAHEVTPYFARAIAFLGYMLGADKARREEGIALLTEAGALQGAFGDRYGRGYSQSLLNDLLIESGRYLEALEPAQGYVEVMREGGPLDDHCCALLSMIQICLGLGHLEQARQALSAFYAIPGSADLAIWMSLAAAMGGSCASIEGRFADALPLLVEGEAGTRKMGVYVYATALDPILDGWLQLGRPASGLTVAQEAVFATRTDGNVRSHMIIQLWLGTLEAALGHWDAAHEHLAQARQVAENEDARAVLAKVTVAEAEVALGRGQHDAAVHLIELAQAQASELGMLPQLMRLAELRGELALAGNGRDAGAHFQTMQALADQIGAPFPRARALFGQARALPRSPQAPGQVAEAQRVVAGLAEAFDEVGKAEFLAFGPCQAILEADALVRPAPSDAVEGNRQIGTRFQRVTSELAGLAEQYEVMFQDWQASNAQLRQLNELATRLNESLNVDEVLHQVVKLTLEITRAERGFVILQEAGRYGDLVYRAGFDAQGRGLSNATFSLSICQRVVSSGKALTILDASADADFQSSKSIVALDIKTVMAVPLQSKGKTLGVLYVDSAAVVTTFTEKDLDLLRSVAAHASVAIENATLYSALDRRAAELEEALALYRKAERDASTDMLTGLANRRHFNDFAGRELSAAQRYSRPLSVVMLDVDHFKQFNDTYGHAVGDEVLKAIGRVLPLQVRTSDLAARLGGEEFVVLCPDTAAIDAALLAERIREAIMRVELFDADGAPVRQLTASLGVAEMRLDDAAIDQTLERADQALYECKRNGRNQVQIWKAGMLGG